ncbi:pyridoxal-phosphate dependent enzyme [Sneathiella chungangensis]|uniref:Pyridoxal-phosphate dependent enzyme n=1 Tax=Sneathiella chungangensis TaxID=1418234 RepID=A0A845ML31_9PROT|nr:threonine/serine dehydratase [Sneathiella chungangensis]MZR23574.1 pyridoxal-phosphate dependent enzyme [Sneathiella chungangensis]
MVRNFTIEDIEAARQRLSTRIRRTPQMEFDLDTGLRISAKLENLQISGSFKIRGALNTVLGLDGDELTRGLVTASGGNHGMGVATAGAMTGTPTTIFLPENTPLSKIEKLKKIASHVIVVGAVWDDANALALRAAEEEGKRYIHPFADISVLAGQGTIGLEILEEAPDIDVLLVAIGGGGLISGIATAVKARNPDIRIIGVEAVGAPTLKSSIEAGALVTLESIETKAGTLAPRRSAEINFRIISELVDDIVLVTDEAMKQSAEWLWENVGLGVELSAAAAIAALRSGEYKPPAGAKTGVVICGAGPDGFSFTG